MHEESKPDDPRDPKHRRALTALAYRRKVLPTLRIPPDLDGEEWRDVLGWEGIYQVSNCGRLRRIVSSSRGQPIPRIRVLSPAVNRAGYPYAILTFGERREHRPIHQWVAQAFLGQRPEGHEVNHIDGVKTNNRADNLEWATKSRNMRHALESGLRKMPRGQAHWNVRLTPTDVRAIRALRGTRTQTRTQIARAYGVSASMVDLIWARKRWHHLD